jgi:septal ring factor EnvC (AmiA/AmiB activator)
MDEARGIKMVKFRYMILVIGFAAAILVWQFVIRANAQTATNAPQMNVSQHDQYQHLLDAQEARSKRAEDLFAKEEEAFKRQEEHITRYEKLTDRQEKLLDRQEKNIERYEKILETWEKQQQQYQKYLDSLGNK